MAKMKKPAAALDSPGALNPPHVSETRAKSARVQSKYESLDAEGTKKAYDELNGILDGLATTVIHTLDEMVPHMAAMQSLLSQRGSVRKRVLKTAGLQGWMDWAKAYAAKYNCSVRTIQERINLFRTATSDGEKRSKRSGKDKPFRLDHRQQAALVRAQASINDVVAALKNDGDWRTPLAEYDKVAVTPARLDSFVNALTQETDWADVLAQFVSKLEQYGDRLPVAVTSEMRSIKGLIEGKTQQPTAGRQTKLASKRVTTPSGAVAGPSSGPVTGGILTPNGVQEKLQGTLVSEVLAPEPIDHIDSVADSPAQVTDQDATPTDVKLVWLPLGKGKRYEVRPVPPEGYGIYEVGSSALLQWHGTRDDARDAITAITGFPRSALEYIKEVCEDIA